jgi:hypothetical protein
MIAMSPGDADLMGSSPPFTPKSHYFGHQGGEILDGLLAVNGATALGKGVAGLVGSSARELLTHRPVADLLAEANAPINGSGISQATRAWDKHAGRPGGTFEPLTGTTAEKNTAVSEWVNGVLTNSETTMTQLPRGGVEYRLPSGQGLVFEPGGKVNLLDPRWTKK